MAQARAGEVEQNCAQRARDFYHWCGADGQVTALTTFTNTRQRYIASIATKGEAAIFTSADYHRVFPGMTQEVMLMTFVGGNLQTEDMEGYFPLRQNHTLKFYSFNAGKGTLGKLQIKTANPVIYEGQQTWPLDFIKDSPDAYWAPGVAQNLRWHVVGFTASAIGDFIWAKGDQRYGSDAANGIVMQRRFRYDSLEAGKLPYMLMPKSLKTNPGNDGLGNAVNIRQVYPNCQTVDGRDCALNPQPQHNSWFMGVRNAVIDVPGVGQVPAKWVEYVEVSLPGMGNDAVTSPFTADRDAACRKTADGSYYYSGVREDWFFVKGVGPALILTRNIKSNAACVYEVVREPLHLRNADTVTMLMSTGQNGYDPNWDY